MTSNELKPKLMREWEEEYGRKWTPTTELCFRDIAHDLPAEFEAAELQSRAVELSRTHWGQNRAIRYIDEQEVGEEYAHLLNVIIWLTERWEKSRG